ncbi:MAG: redoxin domain-containing protein, partial [Pseudomonadota bacterium]
KAVVFLSSVCPCSKSHVNHLNQLSLEFPELKLFGVITDDRQVLTQRALEKYYSESRFQFSVLADPNQKLVKAYGALKTPHVVLMRRRTNGDYERVYSGGVSDQRDFAAAGKLFLRDNLVALREGRVPPHASGRSLGCYIRRF